MGNLRKGQILITEPIKTVPMLNIHITNGQLAKNG